MLTRSSVYILILMAGLLFAYQTVVEFAEGRVLTGLFALVVAGLCLGGLWVDHLGRDRGTDPWPPE